MSHARNKALECVYPAYGQIALINGNDLLKTKWTRFLFGGKKDEGRALHWVAQLMTGTKINS